MGNSASIRRWSRVCLTLAFWIVSGFKPSLGLVQKNAKAKEDSDAPENHFAAAQTYQIAGDFGRTAAEYRRGISIALQRLGNLKFSNGDNAGGLEALKKAVNTDAGNIDAQIDLGIVYFRGGDYNSAKECVQGVLKSEGDNFRARNLLGKIDFMQGNFESAANELQAALTITPDFDVAYSLALADLQLKKHQLEQAEKTLQEAHRTSPDDPGPLLLLGRLYNEQRKSSAAITVLRQAISLLSSGAAPASQTALAHEMLSNAYISAGQTAEGGEELAAAKRIGATETGVTGKTSTQESIPSRPAATSQELRAMLMEKEKQPKVPAAAQAHYVSAISKLLGNAYNNLGVMDARNNLYKDAAEEFKQAELWDSSIPQVDRNFALAAFRAQLYGDAIGPIERLVHNSPTDQNLRQMLALSYYMTNRFTDNAVAFRPIVDSLPQNPGLLLSAGIAFVKSGDTSTAYRR